MPTHGRLEFVRHCESNGRDEMQCATCGRFVWLTPEERERWAGECPHCWGWFDREKMDELVARHEALKRATERRRLARRRPCV